jgi:hypothetical protein
VPPLGFIGKGGENSGFDIWYEVLCGIANQFSLPFQTTSNLELAFEQRFKALRFDVWPDKAQDGSEIRASIVRAAVS